MYRLKEAVIVFRENKNTIIQLGTSRFKILDEYGQFYNFISNKDRIININTTNSREEKYIEFLKKECLITENVEYSEDRFIKNEYFFEDISRSLLRNSCQSSLKMKKVVIVGLGGLGTVVLKNLVAIGVMEFTIVDADVVDISNLNRQLYFTYKDIGKSKVEVLKEYLYKYDSDIKVHIVKEFITENTIDLVLSNSIFDLIVNAADMPTDIVSVVANKAYELDVPFITGGVGLRTGTFTNVLLPKKVKSILKYYEGNSCETPMKGSISTTNMLVGSFIANEILNFWINDEFNEQSHINFVDFNTYQIEREEL